MRFPTAAVIALAAAVSLSAQTSPDLSTATPIAGSWSYGAASDGSEATFASYGSPVQLWIRCARATRRVSIAKPAATAAPFLNIWTSAQTRSVPASFNPASRRITAELGAYDSLLDALANSRGRVGFTTGAQPSLVLPAWPEITRVIEDCRA
jgi:hypothetical protein